MNTDEGGHESSLMKKRPTTNIGHFFLFIRLAFQSYRRHRGRVYVALFNIAVIVVGAWAIAIIHKYGNDEGVGNVTFNLVQSTTVFLRKQMDHLFLMPIHILDYNSMSFRYNYVDLGPNMDGLTEDGELLNTRDYWFATQLASYSSAISFIYYATSTGYYFGVLPGDWEGEEILFDERNSDGCSDVYVFVGEGGFRRDGWVEYANATNEEDCLALGGFQAVPTEMRTLCVSEDTLDTRMCREFGDTYFGCGEDEEDAAGYVWLNDTQECPLYDNYDARETEWFRTMYYSEEDAKVWEAYIDRDIHSLVLSVFTKIVVNGIQIVHGVDLSIESLMELFDLLPLGEKGNRVVLLMLYDDPLTDGGLSGTVLSSDDDEIRELINDGYVVNVLTRTASNEEGETVEFEPSPLLSSALEDLTDWLESDIDLYVTPQDDIVGLPWEDVADPIIGAARVSEETYLGAVAILAFPRSYVFEYGGPWQWTSIWIIVAVFTPILFTLYQYIKAYLEHMRVDLRSYPAIRRIVSLFDGGSGSRSRSSTGYTHQKGPVVAEEGVEMVPLVKSPRSKSLPHARDEKDLSFKRKQPQGGGLEDYVTNTFGVKHFLVLTVIVIFGVYAVWAVYGMEDVTDIASDFTNQVTVSLNTALMLVLKTPMDVLVRSLGTLQQLSEENEGPSRNDTLYSGEDPYLVTLVESFEGSETPMDFIFLSYSDGSLRGAQLQMDGTITINVFNPEVLQDCYLKYNIFPNKTANTDSIYERDCNFSPYSQPWFIAASNTTEFGSVHYTTVYEMSSGVFGITLFAPFEVNNTVRGVFGIDVSLNSLNSRVTNGQFVEAHDVAYFVFESFGSDNSGALVIASNGDVYDEVYGTTLRRNATASSDVVITLTASTLAYEWEAEGSIDEESIIGYGDLRSKVRTMDLNEVVPVEWHVVVAFPRESYMDEMDEWANISMLVAIGMVMVVSFVAVIARNAYRSAVEEDDSTVSHHDEAVQEDLDHMIERIKRHMGRLPGTVDVTNGSCKVTTSVDLRDTLFPGDSVRIGGYRMLVSDNASAEFGDDSFTLREAYPGPSSTSTSIYRSNNARNESEAARAKRFIMDARAGRNVLDLIGFERAGDEKRRNAYYFRTSWGYNVMLRLTMVAHLILGFFEAPGLEYEASDSRRQSLLVCEIIFICIEVLDIFVELLINGMYYVDGDRREIRHRNFIRLTMTVLILLDWILRASGLEYTTGFEDNELLLPYSSVLRPVLVVAQSDALNTAWVNFFSTVVGAKDVFVVLMCFLVVAASMGMPLFEGVYNPLHRLGRGFDDFQAAFLTMFIFISTGENYPDVVYPAAIESSYFKLYFFIFFFIGMFLLVSLIIAIFQDKYTANEELVKQAKRHRVREGMVTAYIILDTDESGYLESDEYLPFFLDECKTTMDLSLLQGIHLDVADFVDLCENIVNDFNTAESEKVSNPIKKVVNEDSMISMLLAGRPLYPSMKRHVMSKHVQATVQMLVLANIWGLSLMSTRVGSDVSPLFLVLILLYAAELCLKISALGFDQFWNFVDSREHRFQRWGNRFDFAVITITVFLYTIDRCAAGSIMLEEEDPKRVIVALPTLRILSVVEMARSLVFGIFQVLSGLSILFALLLVVIYMFSAVGCILFAGALSSLPTAIYSMKDANFDSLEEAFTTLFQLMGGESWSSTMYATIDATASLAVATYFVAYVCIITLLFVNLFIGVVCDAFHTLEKNEDIGVDNSMNILEEIIARHKKAEEEETSSDGSVELVGAFVSEGDVKSQNEWIAREKIHRRTLDDLRSRLFFSIGLSKKMDASAEGRTCNVDLTDLWDVVEKDNVPVEKWDVWLDRKMKVQGKDGGNGHAAADDEGGDYRGGSDSDGNSDGDGDGDSGGGGDGWDSSGEDSG